VEIRMTSLSWDVVHALVVTIRHENGTPEKHDPRKWAMWKA